METIKNAMITGNKQEKSNTADKTTIEPKSKIDDLTEFELVSDRAEEDKEGNDTEDKAARTG